MPCYLQMHSQISTAFISHAVSELTSRDYDLSGGKIVEITSAYAVDFGADIPHARYPFRAPNKRTALFDNLLAFQPKQQHQIMRELCDRLDADGSVQKLVALKVKLMSEYAQFAHQYHATDVHRTLVVARPGQKVFRRCPGQARRCGDHSGD